MEIYRALYLSAGLGVIVPIVLVSFSKLINGFEFTLSPRLDYYFFLFKTMIWFGSFPFMAVPLSSWPEYLLFLVLATAINVLTYCIFGALIWVSVYKYSAAIYLVIMVLFAYWALLLTI